MMRSLQPSGGEEVLIDCFFIHLDLSLELLLAGSLLRDWEVGCWDQLNTTQKSSETTPCSGGVYAGRSTHFR